jgi:ActR/RegA family two-component response regulator
VLLEKDHQVAEIYYREADIPAGEVLVLSPHLQGETELLDLVYNMRQRETRIVLLAGDLEPAEVWRAFNLGVYDILFDPVKVRDIVEAVQFPKKFKDVSEMLVRRGLKEQQAVAVREVEKIVVKEVKKVTRQEIHTW